MIAGDASSDAIDHEPVMLAEIIQGLTLENGNTVVDATAGRGGHAQAIAKMIGSTGTLVLLDRDQKILHLPAKEFGQCRKLQRWYPCTPTLQVLRRCSVGTHCAPTRFLRIWDLPAIK